MSKYKYYIREFLNPEGFGGLACIHVQVKDYDERRAKTAAQHEAGEEVSTWFPSSIEFSISDCSRTIYLDFDIGGKADRESSIHKLNRLISIMTEFREHLTNEAAAAEQFEKIKEEQRERRGNVSDDEDDLD